jgi:hypothetical protein
MKVITQIGEPIRTTRMKLNSTQAWALTLLHSHWQAANSFTVHNSTWAALWRHGLIERAHRKRTPAYPKRMWWFRHTPAGKRESERILERYKRELREDRIAQGLPVPKE